MLGGNGSSHEHVHAEHLPEHSTELSAVSTSRPVTRTDQMQLAFRNRRAEQLEDDDRLLVDGDLQHAGGDRRLACGLHVARRRALASSQAVASSQTMLGLVGGYGAGPLAGMDLGHHIMGISARGSALVGFSPFQGSVLCSRLRWLERKPAVQHRNFVKSR